METVKDTRPVKDLLLIHTCCADGYKLVKLYAERHPEYQLKVKAVGIFNARDQGLDKTHGFDIKELEGSGHGILVVDDKIYAKC